MHFLVPRALILCSWKAFILCSEGCFACVPVLFCPPSLPHISGVNCFCCIAGYILVLDAIIVCHKTLLYSVGDTTFFALLTVSVFVVVFIVTLCVLYRNRNSILFGTGWKVSAQEHQDCMFF